MALAPLLLAVAPRRSGKLPRRRPNLPRRKALPDRPSSEAEPARRQKPSGCSTSGRPSRVRARASSAFLRPRSALTQASAPGTSQPANIGAPTQIATTSGTTAAGAGARIAAAQTAVLISAVRTATTRTRRGCPRVVRCGERANGGRPSRGNSSFMRSESTRVPGTQSEELYENRSPPAGPPARPHGRTGAPRRPHPNQVMRAVRPDRSIRPVSASGDMCAVPGLGSAG